MIAKLLIDSWSKQPFLILFLRLLAWRQCQSFTSKPFYYTTSRPFFYIFFLTACSMFSCLPFLADTFEKLILVLKSKTSLLSVDLFPQKCEKLDFKVAHYILHPLYWTKRFNTFLSIGNNDIRFSKICVNSKS